MGLQSTMLLKEARSLLWPWCAVTLGAAFSWAMPSRSWFDFAGFWFGMPLLAALLWGNEFQHRTLPLLLSQPVERMTIWSAKLSALAAAVVSSGIVYALTFAASPLQQLEELVLGAIWIVVTVCSCTFWTLVARSTIGGLVLNLMQGTFIGAAVTLAHGFLSPDASLPSTALFVIAAAALCYAVVMLWLGRRMLARFQATAEIAGNDLLMRGPHVMRVFVSWLRCRRNGVLLNLIRKEVRLLWPVWLLTILCVVVLIGLAPLQFVPAGTGRNWMNVPVAIVTLYGFVMLILAGSVSMGEERTLRTQSWQLTLPVSADLQWFLKLIMVVLSAFVGLLVVVHSARLIFGKPFTDALYGSVGGHEMLHLLSLSLLSIAAFWCACGVNGTVRAVLFTVPAISTVWLASHYGLVAAMGLTGFSVASSLPFGGIYILYTKGFLPGGPALLTALIQSRRLFRREVQDNTSSTTVRYLLLPAMVTFIFVFCLQFLARQIDRRWTALITETHQNVKNLQLDLTNTTVTSPRQLTPDETAKVISSDSARQWLGDSSVAVFSGPMVFARTTGTGTRTRIRLRNGLECTAFDWSGDPASRPSVHCQDADSKP